MSSLKHDSQLIDNIRVLLIAPLPPPWGGIARWTCLLRSWMRGQDNVILNIVDTAPRWRDCFDTRTKQRILAGFIQWIWEMYQVIANILCHRPSIMHLTTSGGIAGFRDISILFINKVFRLKSIYHFRFGRLPDVIKYNGWEWRILNKAAHLASSIIVVDEASARIIRPLFPKTKVIFIPNAIDLKSLPKESSISGDSVKRILFVGWVLPTKGLNELAEAWKMISSTGWELVILGPGPTSYKNDLIARFGHDPRFRILAEVPNEDAWDWILSAEIFVLPTYTEGFPNVILEAMAAAKPIVATPVGAIPGMLDFDGPEPCGLRVPARDSASLAEALEKLMLDPALRAQLGQRARNKVELTYDVSTIFPKIINLWYEEA